MAVRASYNLGVTPPEYWLMGCVPGDDEPVLLECGTKQECDLALTLYENEGGYAELFLLGIVQYSANFELNGEEE